MSSWSAMNSSSVRPLRSSSSLPSNLNVTLTVLMSVAPPSGVEELVQVRVLDEGHVFQGLGPGHLLALVTQADLKEVREIDPPGAVLALPLAFGRDELPGQEAEPILVGVALDGEDREVRPGSV